MHGQENIKLSKVRFWSQKRRRMPWRTESITALKKPVLLHEACHIVSSSVWHGTASSFSYNDVSITTKVIVSNKNISSSSCSRRVRCVFLFLGPLNEVGPSISSSVVLCSFVLLAYIVVLALVVYLCPSSVRVVATFSGTVWFPLLCPVLTFFP
jgi:hypothetical protein